MSILIAVDPGITTGIAVIRIEDGSLVHNAAFSASDLMAWLRLMVQDEHITTNHLVYEQFRLYGGGVGASKTFSDLPEVRIIGAITDLCEAYHISVASLPAGVYKTASAQWVPPPELKGQHQKDAWRLGMWFHVVRLKRPATITLKGGRVYNMNVTETEHEEVTGVNKDR